MERAVIQELRHVLWPLDHGELDFALHTAKAVWAKSASEMTPAGRAE